MSIGNRIKLTRTKAGMSQEDLALACKVEKTMVSHWEADRREPSCERIVRLCNALAISADYLLGLSHRE